MKHIMQPYYDLLKDIYENGVDVMDRTGTGRRKVFGRMLRFNVKDEFPLDTSRPIPYKSFIRETLWFIKGSNDIRELGAKIWDLWAVTPENFETFMEQYPDLNDETKAFLREDMLPVVESTIGSLYGKAWRAAPQHHYNYFYPEVKESDIAPDRLARIKDHFEKGYFVDDSGAPVPFEQYLQMAYYEEIDQLQELIRNLKERPNSSRLIISAWIPEFIPFEQISPQNNVIMGKGALAPCHVLQQYLVLPPATPGGKQRLSLMMTQR